MLAFHSGVFPVRPELAHFHIANSLLTNVGWFVILEQLLIVNLLLGFSNISSESIWRCDSALSLIPTTS